MPEPHPVVEAAAEVVDDAVLDLEALGLNPLEISSALIATGLRVVDEGADLRTVLTSHRFILEHVQGRLGELFAETQAELGRHLN